MNRFIQRVLLVTATLFSVSLVWLMPHGLVELQFLGRDFEPHDGILFLFAATLALPFWGSCIYALYREHTSRLLALIGWILPLCILIFYARTAGTYRATIIAISVMSLIICGNGLGRTTYHDPRTRSRVALVFWIIIGVIAGRFCLMKAPFIFSAGTSALIFSGAYLDYCNPKSWVCRCIWVLAILQLLNLGALLLSFGFIEPDYFICIAAPLLSLIFAFTEARWGPARQ